MNPQELLSKYIKNKLSSEEKKEFDRLRSSDQKFNTDVIFQNGLEKVTKDKEKGNYREALSESKGNVHKKKNLPRFLIVAFIALLLGITYFTWINPSVSNENLFVKYFKPYANITQPIVRSDAQESIKEAAFYAYENNQFEKALSLFDQVLINKEEANVRFYKANVLLSLDQPIMAISVLERDISTIDSFSEKRLWYLALSYLKLNNTEKSKEALLLLLNVPNNEYKKIKAVELLKKID